MITLIRTDTKELIGTIELQYLPRKDELIEYNNQIFVVSEIKHSTEGVKISVFLYNSVNHSTFSDPDAH